MNADLSRLFFAALCGIFFFAIAGLGLSEWLRFTRGQSALPARHLRLRLASALVWLIVLGSFIYAMLALWPAQGLSLAPGAHEQAQIKRLGFVLMGATVLLIFASVLMAFDFYWTAQLSRRSLGKRAQASQQTLQREIERARSRAAQNGGPRHDG